MAIERAIYSSLPLGIDSDRPGYQFYSYTPGYKALQSSNKAAEARLTASYTAPNTYAYYNRYMEGGQTDEARNLISQQAEDEHPLSFRFRMEEFDGVTKATFSFAKDLGMDWTGARPNTAYHSAVICDPKDVRKAPILYCSSSVVCCDIMREAFFPVGGALEKPSFLPVPASLDDDTFLLHHAAGFTEITPEDISRFLFDDERLPIFQRMLAALMRCKDGDARFRLVIADRKENVILWIAALSHVFPQKRLLRLSFNTYSDHPEDYDINGVFVPELDGLALENGITSATRYSAQQAMKEYAVFDFHEQIFASDMDDPTGAFMGMIQTAVTTLDMGCLEEYKDYAEKQTSYEGMGTAYADGYELFRFLHLNQAPATSSMRRMADFARQYAPKREQKALFDAFVRFYPQRLKDTELLAIIGDYNQFCLTSGVISQGALERAYMDDCVSAIQTSDTITWEQFVSLATAVETLCGFSGKEIELTFMKRIGMDGAESLAETLSERWKLSYLQSALSGYIVSKRLPLAPGSQESRVMRRIAERLFSDADGEESRKSLRKNLSVFRKKLGRPELYIRYAQIMRGVLEAQGAEAALNELRAFLREDYMGADSDTKRALLRLMSHEDNLGEYTNGIITEISRMPSDEAVKELWILLSEREAAASCAARIRDEAQQILRKEPDPSPHLRYRVYRVVLEACQRNHLLSADMNTEGFFQGYFDAVFRSSPDFRLDTQSLTELKYMGHEIERHSINRPDLVNFVRAYVIMDEMRGQIAAGEFRISVTHCSTEPVECDLLSKKIQESFLQCAAEMCAQFWLDGGRVQHGVDVLHTSTDRAFQSVSEKFLLSALEYLLRDRTSKEACRKAVDVMKFAIDQDNQGVLKQIPALLSRYSYRQKEILKILKKDLQEAKEKERKGKVIKKSEQLRHLLVCIESECNGGRVSNGTRRGNNNADGGLFDALRGFNPFGKWK